MCSPTAIGVMMVASAVTGGYGAYQEQKAQNKANEYNASMAERNANIADMQARDAERRGSIEERQHRRKVAQLKGSQRAAIGASGAAVDTGSSMDVIQDTTDMGELDAMTIKYNTAVESWGHQQEAGLQRSYAEFNRARSRNPWEAAGLTILTAGSSMGVKYGMANPSGGNTKQAPSGGRSTSSTSSSNRYGRYHYSKGGY